MDLYEFVQQKIKEENNYCVYMLTSPEGKIYIGYAEMPVEKRWANGRNYKNNKALSADIKKFGWDRFRHEIISEGIPKDVARNMEAEMIKAAGSTDPEKGYNGQIPKQDPKGWHYTVYQLIFPDGKQYVGKTGTDFRKRWANGKGYRTNKELTRAIEKCGRENVFVNIVCEGMSYETASAQENILIEFNRTNDPERGYNKSLGGEKEHGWRVDEETVKRVSNERRGRQESTPEQTRQRQLGSVRNKPVRCIETGEVFCSSREAERKTGICRMSISKAARGKLRKAGGMRWEYV